MDKPLTLASRRILANSSTLGTPRSAAAAPLVVRARFVEDRTVGWSCSCCDSFPSSREMCGIRRRKPSPLRLSYDFQQEGRLVVRCLFGAGPVPETDSSRRSEIARKTQLPRPDGRLSSLVGGAEVGKERVCTMCTPWASDRVVLVPDWAGLRRFSGEWRKFKGWNPVRVPPRARVFPVQGLVGL